MAARPRVGAPRHGRRRRSLAVATCAGSAFFPYFGALRWLGRSFVEVESPRRAHADAQRRRAAEPLAGAFSIVAAFALFFSREL